MRYAILFAVLLAGCSKDPAAPKPRDFHLSDPEILFHFYYHRDSLGVLHTDPTPDTAVMRWYRDSTVNRLLAQVEITGNDSVCAFFLVTSGTPMYFDLGWKRHGVTTFYNTVGPFDPTNPDNYDHYWNVGMYEDTLSGSVSADISSSPTTSFCPSGPGALKRDSITAAPLP